MNTKPPIYAYCPAGCKFETVHKEDFLNAATYFEQSIKDGRCYLEIGKQYKIYKNDLSSITITLKYKDVLDGSTEEKEYLFNVPNNDKYANAVVFKLLEVINETATMTIVYEMAGVRYTEVVSGYRLVLGSENYLYTDNADRVCLYNDEAAYTLIGGESYTKEETEALIDEKITNSITTALGGDY